MKNMDQKDEINSASFSSLDSTTSPANSASYSSFDSTITSPANSDSYSQKFKTNRNGQLAINKISLIQSKRNCTIKARVEYKSGIKTWSKPSSKGRYFTVHLTDESDSIAAKAFNEACDLFYPELKLNEQYIISQCYILPVDRIYNHLPHDCELRIGLNSSIRPVIHYDTPNSKIERRTVKTWTLYDLACDLKGKNEWQRGIFFTEATIMWIKKGIDQVVYKACPSPYCKKKVVRTEDMTELYYCEKCDETYPDYVYRFMLPILIADWTGILWITMFEDAERFLGVTPEKIVKIHDTDPEKYDSYFKRLYESYTFVIGANMQIYNEEDRVNAVGESFSKIDFEGSCWKMITDLKRLTKTNDLSIL